MSREASASPPVLPAPSGATLLLIGYYYEAAAFLTGITLVAEAYLPGRWYYWAAGIMTGVAILLSLSGVNTFRGNRRLAEEKHRGYTTALGDALKDPSLYYVDRKTLRVLAGPHESRPRRRPTS